MSNECKHGQLARSCNYCEWERDEAEYIKRIAELEAATYDAYGLGLEDGLEMAKHPAGLGGKTQAEVLAEIEAKEETK